jgi:hypothetical protein
VFAGVRLYNYAIAPKIKPDPGFAQNGVVYAFTDGAIFVSIDGGLHFSPVTQPVDPLYTNNGDLAVTDQGRRLFLGTWTLDKDAPQGLFMSTDAGASWTKVENPLFDKGVQTIRISGTHVLVGLQERGVACSADLGATWGARC